MESTVEAGRYRRRGAELEQAIYAAALSELADVGYAQLTMDSVAARAGTGKAALYRRWASKQELLLAALRDSLPPLPAIDRGVSARDNLLAVFAVMSGHLARDPSPPGLMLAFQLAYDPVLRDTVVEAVIASRLAMIQEILRHAVDTGEVSSLEALTPMAASAGPALIVLTFLTTGHPPTQDDLGRIADTVLAKS
ncbi:TetR/AcrR family transcriptional regulator [Fodinicola feengrottensis]|uniref:TetR/AcrR family transcriptional regulator n=1 Tax=Fodinicola feengrottensis TaxID=435914 RepID=A0ABP4U3J5_9ACTN|nr:TetR/AcrR family transcriptional regulator [Fodinicola feengrottensis]